MRHRAKAVTTRKPHNCWFCGMEISIGSLAISFFVVDTDQGARPLYGHACLGCARINNVSETRSGGLEIAD